MKHPTRWAIVLALGLVLLLGGGFTPAQAGRVVGDTDITVPEGDVVQEDLYLFGERVVIAGRVEGDVHAVAREILITGEIAGDAVLAAQVIDIQGQITDDLRAAGAIVRVRGLVGDDVLAAGMAVEIRPQRPVAGDVWAAGYQVYITDVQGNVWTAGNGVTIAGQIGGSVQAAVGDSEGPPVALLTFFIPVANLPTVPAGLTLTSEADIAGDLIYRSFQTARLDPGATIRGNITHQLPQPPDTNLEPEIQWGTRPWLIAQGRRWITLLLMGVVSFLIAASPMRRLGRYVAQRPLPALGWGLVTVLGVIGAFMLIFLAGLLMAILFGLLSLTTLAMWSLILTFGLNVVIVLAYLAYTTLLAPAVVGYGMFSRWDRGPYRWIVLLVVGVTLYVGASALPYLGRIVQLLVWLWALGALWLFWRTSRPAPGSPPPPSPEGHGTGQGEQ